MHGIYVRLTHTGTTNAPLLLQDIYPTTDGHTAYRRAGPVYVPVGESVRMTYTGEVAASFESGTIRGFVNLGYLRAEILFGDGVAGTANWSATVPGTGTPTDLLIEGEPGHLLVLPDNTACQFEVRVVALDSGDPSQAAWWDLSGGITRGVGAGSTALIGANIGFTQNAGGASAAWSIQVAADPTSGALSLTATVPASVGDVRFAATGHLTPVSI